MRRSFAVLLALAGCHHHPEHKGYYGVLLPKATDGCGVDQVNVCVETGDVVVFAHGFPAGAPVTIEIDIDEPHASVACQAAWRRDVTADADGTAVAGFEINVDDDCAPHDTMKAWVTMPDGTDVTSAPFDVPQRTSP